MASVDSITDAQASTIERLVDALLKWLFNVWESNDDWSDENTDTMVAETVEMVLDFLEQARRAMDAYLSETYKEQGLQMPRNIDPPSMDSYPRDNVTAYDVWERPVNVYRKARKNGDTKNQAKMKTMKRVRQIADSDMRLAQRERAARTYAKTEKVIGYRRIIHPELSRTGTCGLCIVAADRIYGASELYPMHDNCKCETLPVTKSNDPGLKLNQKDLNRIYKAAGGKNARRLSQTRIKEYTSGEIGPVLTKHAATKDGMTDRNKQFKVTGEEAESASHVKSPAQEAAKQRWTKERMKERMGNASKKAKPYYKRQLTAAEKAEKYWNRQNRKAA